MPETEQSSALRTAQVGFLAWLLPGLGHIYLGYRKRGLILLITISLTFWLGVAIGGLRGTVDPEGRKAWFVAELCSGGHTLVALALHRSVTPASMREGRGKPVPIDLWSPVDVGVHYAGVAGLLNVLVILDALMRSDPSYLRRAAQTAESIRQGGGA